MSKGQEIEHTVVAGHGHTLVVGNHGCIILSAGEYDAFGVTGGSAGVENVGYVVHRCLLLARQHLTLARQSVAKTQEIVEADGGSVARCYRHSGVEHDDALQCLTRGEHAAGFVVLLLFANKEETHLGIVDDKLYLLLAAGGIERNGDGTNAPGTKVGKQILHRVL